DDSRLRSQSGQIRQRRGHSYLHQDVLYHLENWLRKASGAVPSIRGSIVPWFFPHRSSCSPNNYCDCLPIHLKNVFIRKTHANTIKFGTGMPDDDHSWPEPMEQFGLFQRGKDVALNMKAEAKSFLTKPASFDE